MEIDITWTLTKVFLIQAYEVSNDVLQLNSQLYFRSQCRRRSLSLALCVENTMYPDLSANVIVRIILIQKYKRFRKLR